MTHRSLAVLIVLNVALLAALSVTVLAPPPAHAQFNDGRQFTMLAGQSAQRSGQSVIYVLDLNSARVLPLFFVGATDEFQIFSGRNIGDDLRNARPSR